MLDCVRIYQNFRTVRTWSASVSSVFGKKILEGSKARGPLDVASPCSFKMVNSFSLRIFPLIPHLMHRISCVAVRIRDRTQARLRFKTSEITVLISGAKTIYMRTSSFPLLSSDTAGAPVATFGTTSSPLCVSTTCYMLHCDIRCLCMKLTSIAMPSVCNRSCSTVRSSLKPTLSVKSCARYDSRCQ